MLRRLKRRLTGSPRILASVEAYALWSASYPPYPHNRLMEIEQAAMLRLMPALSGRVVLDLACGTGRYGQIAREAGARRVVGLDSSAAMLRWAAYRPLAEATMIALPLPDSSCDVIVCGLATGHLPPDAMQQAISEIARILRPGGDVLFSDFHPYWSTRGGQRQFSAPDGTIYAVEHYTHQIADYSAAITAAGMVVTATEEPTAEIGGRIAPAVLVMRASVRPGLKPKG